MYTPPNPRKTPQYASKENFTFFDKLFEDQKQYKAKTDIHIQIPDWSKLESMPDKLDGAFDIQASFLHKAHFIKNPQIRLYCIELSNQVFSLINQQLFDLTRRPQTLEQIFAGSWLDQVNYLLTRIHWLYEHDTGILELTNNCTQSYQFIQKQVKLYYNIDLPEQNWQRPRFTHIHKLNEFLESHTQTFLSHFNHPSIQNVQQLLQNPQIENLSPYHKYHLDIIQELNKCQQYLSKSLEILIHMHLETSDIQTTNYRHALLPQTSIQDFIQARLYPFIKQFLIPLDDIQNLDITETSDGIQNLDMTEKSQSILQLESQTTEPLNQEISTQTTHIQNQISSKVLNQPLN